MSNALRIVLLLAALVALMALFVVPAVSAQSEPPPEQGEITGILTELGEILGIELTALTGLITVGAIVVNIGKKLGWIPDDYGGTASVVAACAIVGLYYLAQYLGYDLALVDKVAGIVGKVALVVLGQLGIYKAGRAMKLPGFKARAA